MRENLIPRTGKLGTEKEASVPREYLIVFINFPVDGFWRLPVLDFPDMLGRPALGPTLTESQTSTRKKVLRTGYGHFLQVAIIFCGVAHSTMICDFVLICQHVAEAEQRGSAVREPESQSQWQFFPRSAIRDFF